MATISSVGAGQTYTTWALWEAAWAVGGWIGEQVGNLTAGCTISGNSPSGVNYTELRCASGQAWYDNANVQTNAFSFNSSNGAAITSTAAYSVVFTAGEDYITFKGLQISASNGFQVMDNNDNGRANCIIDRCIIEQNNSSENIIRWRAGVVRNSLLVMRHAGAKSGIDAPFTGTLVVVGNTIVRPSNFTPAGTGIDSTGAFIENNLIFGFSTFATGTNTGGTNGSDVAIGFGSGNKASVTYANQFVTTTDSGRDFKSKTGADGIGVATVDTTNNPSGLDAPGTARGAAWDMGAWELAGGGGGSTVRRSMAALGAG